jgi:hypothetical protein
LGQISLSDQEIVERSSLTKDLTFAFWSVNLRWFFKRRRISRLCCLYLVLVQPIIVQARLRETQGISQRSLQEFAISHHRAAHAVVAAASYIERACGPDGRFVYRVDFRIPHPDNSYNILRHAGAMYALAMFYRSQGDLHVGNALLRAAAFLSRNYIGPGPRPDQLAVWSRPLPQRTDLELGATGLGLVALTAAHEVDPNSISLDQLEALGRFLVFLQRVDGSFPSKYRMGSGPVPDWESLYYPGEAALGLVSLYEADHDPQWLNAAAKGLSYLAKSRAGLSTVPADHWALIATAKLLPYCEKITCPVSREELLRHTVQVCNSILREQITNPRNPILDGAFDPAGRTAPAATRLEGLLAALEFLPEDQAALRKRIQTACVRGIAFLLRAQIRSGPYTGGMPGAVMPGAKDASVIRIDYVQHALCAWLRYQELASKIDR